MNKKKNLLYLDKVLQPLKRKKNLRLILNVNNGKIM